MSQPKNANTATKAHARLERITALIEKKLEQEPMVLEGLVAAAAKGNAVPEIWTDLHVAAVRDNRIAELGWAYEQLIGGGRLKLLGAGVQAEVLTRAAIFFEEILGDPEKAQDYLNRALAALPGHMESFARLEALLTARQDNDALVKFYMTASGHRSSPEEQLPLLRQAADLAEFLPDDSGLAIKIYQQITRIDANDLPTLSALEALYARSGRIRDAAKWFEQLLANRGNLELTAELDMRERLLRIYRDELSEMDRALPHAERLLGNQPDHPASRELTEHFLTHKALGPRAAAALADSHEKLGQFAEAESLLTAQLEQTRGARRLDLQKRLCVLRQDRLGDLPGAFALLGQLVLANPTDDEIRQRYQQVSAQIDQRAAAFQTISTALGEVKDGELRARILAELGQFAFEGGDLETARSAFEQVLAQTSDDGVLLAAARGLAAMYDSSQPDALASALELVVRREAEEAAWTAAALRLARLYENELADPVKAVETWRSLLSSPVRGEALDALERLYEKTGASEELASIVESRVEGETDFEKARSLAFRAAELRAASMKKPSDALPAWREFLKTYGPSREVHARMLPLLEATESHDELARILMEESRLADSSERVPLLVRAGEIALTRLKDAPRAIEAFRSVLETEPKNRSARRALEALLGMKQGRLLAAQALEPIYRAENDARGVLSVLEVQAQSATEFADWMRILDDAVVILDESLAETPRALQIAGKALRESLQHDATRVPSWIERIERLSRKTTDPSASANVLLKAIGDHAIDSREMFAVARKAGEALLSIGDTTKALTVFRSALAFDPNAEDLSAQVDALVMTQGSAADRIAVHRGNLPRLTDPAKRRAILHEIANIEQHELCDIAAAIATLQTALDEDPTDAVAEEAILDACAARGDWKGLYEGLERALPRAEGERRTTTLLRMAQAASQIGDGERALSHYRELLSHPSLRDDVLDAIEHAADLAGDARMLREALDRRIATATDPRSEAACLERLGDLHANRRSDAGSALECWRRAAKLYDQTVVDQDRAAVLYAKISAGDPNDRDASERLVELYTQRQDAKGLAALYDEMVRHATDERDAIHLVMAMEPWAAKSGTSAEHLSTIDVALKRYLEAVPARVSRLLAVKARLLAADANRADDAARLFRSLIAAASSENAPALVESFDAFLKQAAPTEGRHDDQRWLELWRARNVPELGRVEALLGAATACEASGDRAGALEAYRHLLEIDPDRMAARFATVRLLSEMNDVHGAFAALSDLRDRTAGDVRAGVVVKMGRLLAEQLDRPEDALSTIAPVFESAPDDPTVVSILTRALSRSASRAQAIAMLNRASEHAGAPARAAAILRILADVPADAPELANLRREWFGRLISLQEDDPRAALESALRAVADFPEDETLWEAAERLARRIPDAGPVAEAYRRALSLPMSAEKTEAVARRALDFHEEWFDDSEVVIDLLKRIEARQPSRWAFDRLKLVLSTQERYAELFALYDAAIERARGDGKIELLEEAAETAKDFARDADRAIDYLERLSQLRPLHGSMLTALERLYERKGMSVRLIELLTKRLEENESDKETAQRTRLRIASLCLETGDRETAFRLVEDVLALEPARPEPHDLLARMLLTAKTAGRAAAVDDGWTVQPPTQPLPHALVKRAAAFLKSHYLEHGRRDEVVGMLGIELASAQTVDERIAVHRELVSLEFASAGHEGAAFHSLSALVALEPHVHEHRHQLSELATRLGRHEELAAILLRASEACPSAELRATLLGDAAAIFRDQVGNSARAIELYTQVLGLPGLEPALVLSTARRLEPLLSSANLPAQQCTVLDKIAELETDPSARRAAFGRVAQIAAESLHDLERAAHAWRARLVDDGSDREALDGLAHVLETSRQWSALVQVLGTRAESADPDRAREDRAKVARIQAKELRAPEQAIATWNMLRRVHGADLESFDELSRLLRETRRFEDLAALMQDEANSESATERRTALLGALGDLFREHLGATDRAAASYAQALARSPSDAVARAGLSAIQTDPGARPKAIAALARAYVELEEWPLAADLSATLRAGEDVPAEVARGFWWGVALFHRDVRRNTDFAEASLGRALMFDENSVPILEALASIQSRSSAKNFALTTIRLSDAKGGDLNLLRGAAVAAIRDGKDPALCRATCEKLFDLAVARWMKSREGKDASAERSARVAAAWALEHLVTSAQQSGDHRRAVELLERGAGLPFETGEIRRMKKDAAELCSTRLKDFDSAMVLYRDILREDASDDVAKASVNAFAELLFANGFDEELVTLWEQQAERAKQAEDATAAELWARAATLCEERLHDQDRAIADHRQGASLGGMTSLEALARIYMERGAHEEAASCLERICDHSPPERLVDDTLRLIDAYEAAGKASLGRARMERTVAELGAREPIVSRLGRLYEADEAWESLADLLVSQTARATDTATRLACLSRAIELRTSKLHDAAAAIPLLQQTVELDPDNAARRLGLAEALIAADRGDEAVATLDSMIDRYGTRKPKDRALVHFALARAAKERPRARRELELATRIDPTHAAALHMLARLATEDGELDLAEHSYHALVLLRRGMPDDVPELTRTRLLLDLADIADKKNDPERATELRVAADEARPPATSAKPDRGARPSGHPRRGASGRQSSSRSRPPGQ